MSKSLGDVSSVLCLFCRHFGREDEDGERKRKRTTNPKYFKSPWRSDNFSAHLKNQHPMAWSEYSSMATAGDQQRFFLKNESPESVNMRSFIQPEASMKARITAAQKIKFTIDADIIQGIIVGLLLNNTNTGVERGDDFEQPKRKVLQNFIINEEDNFFVVEVKCALKLNMVTNFVAVGVSFKQASIIYQKVKEETGMGVMGSISDVEVAQHCQIVCAINLQYLKEIFKDVWAFAIAIDAGNNAGTAYLDLRMRCYFKDSLQNFHVLAIPMHERHTGQYQYDLVVEVMDVLSPNWRHQLIGITTDGASAMTGCEQGTSTRLSNECHSDIFRIWCGAHQLDLIVKKAFQDLMNEHKFLDTLTGVTGHLRRQHNLVQEMKSRCPTYVTTRWISMGKVLKWLKVNRVRLLQHFALKKPACTPSADWWIVVITIQALVERIETTFTAMQGMKTLVCEQTRLLAELEHDIKARCNIKGPLTSEESSAFADAMLSDPLHGYQLHNYTVPKQDFVDAIDEVGGFVQISMDELRSSENPDDKLTYDNIISTIAKFSLEIAVGISRICAERDNRNSSADQLPPVLPVDLCSVLTRDFITCLQKQRIRLKQKFSNEEVEKIDDQFRKLRLAAREQTGFSQMLQNAQASSRLQSFEQCWNPLGSEFDELRRFCGAIASVMPGQAALRQISP